MARPSDIESMINSIMEMPAKLAAVVERLDRIAQDQSHLGNAVMEVREAVVNQRPVKEWYTVAEFAATVGRTDWVVRQWCKSGRLSAQKTLNGRSWRVSHEELQRYAREGLLP